MAREKVLGDAIVARLEGATLDARAKSAAKTFAAQHAAYAKLYAAAEAKQEARSVALAAVGEIDARLDAQISRLADRLPAAGLSKRSSPLAPFTKYSPWELCSIGYAPQLAATTKLTKAVRKAKPTRDVIAACDVIDRECAALKKALAAYDEAHAAWVRAIGHRDDTLPEWQKALTRLRVYAKASLFEDPGAYEALFAPPTATIPVRRARKKPPSAPAPGSSAPN